MAEESRTSNEVTSQTQGTTYRDDSFKINGGSYAELMSGVFNRPDFGGLDDDGPIKDRHVEAIPIKKCLDEYYAKHPHGRPKGPGFSLSHTFQQPAFFLAQTFQRPESSVSHTSDHESRIADQPKLYIGEKEREKASEQESFSDGFSSTGREHFDAPPSYTASQASLALPSGSCDEYPQYSPSDSASQSNSDSRLQSPFTSGPRIDYGQPPRASSASLSYDGSQAGSVFSRESLGVRPRYQLKDSGCSFSQSECRLSDDNSSRANSFRSQRSCRSQLSSIARSFGRRMKKAKSYFTRSKPSMPGLNFSNQFSDYPLPEPCYNTSARTGGSRWIY